MSTLALPAHTIEHFQTMTPLEQAVLGYLGTVKNPNTYKLYKPSLNVFLIWCSDNRIDPMTAVRGQVEPYLRDLERGGYEMQGQWRKYSEATISARWGVVRGFYKYATEEELVLRNPTLRIETPKVDLAKQKCTFLPPTEFSKLLDEAKKGTPTEAALLALIGLRGLRISEACSLDIESIQEVQGYKVLSYIGKGGKAHVHVLPVPAMVAINRVIAGRDTGPILVNQAGNRMTRANATRMLKQLAARAGVDTDISPHSMRRSLITSALLMGEDLYDVQRMVGHSQPTTTARYDRLKGDLNRDKVHNVSGFLTALSG